MSQKQLLSAFMSSHDMYHLLKLLNENKSLKAQYIPSLMFTTRSNFHRLHFSVIELNLQSAMYIHLWLSQSESTLQF